MSPTQLFAQFVRYGLSGGTATLTHLAVLTLLVELAAVNPTVATTVGFVIGCIVNYGIQQRFVFQRTGSHQRHAWRYLVVTLFTLGLNLALFWICWEIFGVFYFLSQVLATGVVVPANFVFNKYYTFADARSDQTIRQRAG